MSTNRYLTALGMNTPQDRVNTMPSKFLDARGIAAWGVSKTPAALGAYIAERLKAKAMEMETITKQVGKWGVDVVGSVVVFIGAYSLQYLGTKWKPDSARLFDRITDGMVGYMGLPIIRAAKVLLNKTGLTKFEDVPAEGLDGDAEAVMEIGRLMANSPETIHQMADQMYQAMAGQGVQMDQGAHQAMVRSMYEVVNNLAQGR